MIDHRGERIIPALAGNTITADQIACLLADHPRSRGEYRAKDVLMVIDDGSSPLSRGILSVTGILVEPGRIIPALAGNTASSRAVAAGSGDHPRSRGEYLGVWWICWGRCGSSPLSRGIRVWGEGL